MVNLFKAYDKNNRKTLLDFILMPLLVRSSKLSLFLSTRKVNTCSELWNKNTTLMPIDNWPRWSVLVVNFERIRPFQLSVAFHTEINHLFCFAKQMTCFYMKRNGGLKWFKENIHHITQGCNQNPSKHIRWRFLQKSLTAENR